MADKVAQLPKWNPRATAAQRFQELAVMAERDPSRFNKVVIGWQSIINKEGRTEINYVCVNCQTTDLVGLVELVKQKIFEWTGHGRDPQDHPVP